jgi:hypothetical protein
MHGVGDGMRPGRRLRRSEASQAGRPEKLHGRPVIAVQEPAAEWLEAEPVAGSVNGSAARPAEQSVEAFKGPGTALGDEVRSRHGRRCRALLVPAEWQVIWPSVARNAPLMRGCQAGSSRSLSTGRGDWPRVSTRNVCHG